MISKLYIEMVFLDKVKEQIIWKLVRKGYWGNRPINFDDLFRGFKGIKKRDFEKILREMLEERILLKKMGKYGARYSLNSSKKSEIMEIYGRILGG